MFYITTPKLFRRRDLLTLQLLPAVVVFFAFMVLTIAGWQTAKRSVVASQTAALERKNNETAAYIRQRLNTYEEILRGGVVLFNASEKVEPSEWKNYIDVYDAKHRYSDLRGIGFAQVVDAQDLPSFTESMRQSIPDFTVFPQSATPTYSIVSMAEPIAGSGLTKKGFNMYSDRARAAAMDKARDSGQSIISDETSLFASDASSGPTGFVLFMPVYRHDMPTSTPVERRQAIEGFVFTPFESQKLIEPAFAQADNNYAFEILPNSTQQNKPIYKTRGYDSIQTLANSSKLTTKITASSATWQIQGVAERRIVDQATLNRPVSSLWGGLLFSFFLAGFVYLLILRRSQALSEKEEEGIQAAKDELLALASHQLRTPATGVKQYVGMVREGFAGKLTPTQKKLLDKAYASNERQLATINEMLFVARTDAGNLKMERAKLNLSTIVKEIAEEQSRAIKQRNQTLRLTVPKKDVIMYGDSQYLRMALENIVSNATKYTPLGGTISISLRHPSSKVIFTVKDNGVGVASEDLKLLFRKFSRVPNELTNEVSGSGIGLYLAKKVIDNHGGSIEFTSTPQKGSTVTITLDERPPDINMAS